MTDKVLGYLREGMTIKNACAEAGVTISAVRYKRDTDPGYGKLFNEIVSKRGRPKPGAGQQVTLRSRKVKPSAEAIEFWMRWDDAAASGMLAQRFPVCENQNDSRVRQKK